MNKQQIKKLYQAVYAYSGVRKSLIGQMHAAAALAAAQGIPHWVPNPTIKELDNALYTSSERQAFVRIVQAAKTNSNVEKYLRAAHSLFFLGIRLDPKKL